MISVFSFLGEFLHIGDKKEVEVLMIQRTFCLGGGMFPSRHIRIEKILKSPYLDNKFERGAKIGGIILNFATFSLLPVAKFGEVLLPMIANPPPSQI
jgi:hypothetical protein